MITAVRRIQFCAGHRVVGHEHKCAHLHGHNYVALITAGADELDSVGRVVDFSVIKQRVGGWIEKCWDHGFILWKDDPVRHLAEFWSAIAPHGPGSTQKLFPLPTNPTAENLAEYLLRVVCPEVLADSGCEASKVVVWETENCFAEATL